jgi:translation initiation factor 2B subunit (eIF-2B alpha/beta/delta family)
LDKDESIVRYTANYDKEVAGNFFTNKRIAHYWIDEHSSSKNSLGSAYFDEIVSIDTIYNTTSVSQASFLTITKKDSSRFKVYVSGSRPEVDSFFKPAILAWKKFMSY